MGHRVTGFLVVYPGRLVSLFLQSRVTANRSWCFTLLVLLPILGALEPYCCISLSSLPGSIGLPALLQTLCLSLSWLLKAFEPYHRLPLSHPLIVFLPFHRILLSLLSPSLRCPFILIAGFLSPL